MEGIVYFILLAFLAEILGTIGGFGSSMFFVPIATFFFDFYAALGITALFHVSSNLTKLAMFRKGFDKKLIFSLGIPAIVFVIVGAWLSKKIDTTYLQLILAVFLISMSILLYFLKNLTIPPTTSNSIVGGVVSGFVAGLIGTGGAIRGITLASYGLKVEVFIATSAFIDLGIDASRSIVYVLNGYVKQEFLYLIPILLVVSIAGTFVGKIILRRMSEAQFKSAVLILVFITGLMTLFGTFI